MKTISDTTKITDQMKINCIRKELETYLKNNYSNKYIVFASYSNSFKSITFSCDKNGKQKFFLNCCNGKWFISGENMDADIVIELLQIAKTKYIELFQDSEKISEIELDEL